jgi:hypothetical protein
VRGLRRQAIRPAGSRDTATRMGSGADFSDRGERAAPAQNVDPIDELVRIVGVQAKSRRHAPARVIALLHRDHGATIEELIAATDWLAHTREPKGHRLASSDLHPFEARIAVTREGTKLKTGALLAREWNGRLERVMILDQGVAWNGETYGSLSQVAKAMTGTSWNGHRFFGLQTARSGRSGMVPRRSGDCHAASSGAASTPSKDGGAAFARRPSRQAASP